MVDIRNALFELCDQMNLANLSEDWKNYFEKIYARKSELPFDIDKFIGDKETYVWQFMTNEIMAQTESKEEKDYYCDLGILILYQWWKKNRMDVECKTELVC